MERGLVFFGDANENGYPRNVFDVAGSPTYAAIVAKIRKPNHAVIARGGCKYEVSAVFNDTSE